MPIDQRDHAKGRRLLRELLPWAREKAREDPWEPEMSSPLANATTPYMTEANLDALMIYPAPKGGWHADIVFKTVPPGIPNSIGTPVGSPARTRDEAEKIAKHMLVAVLCVAARNRDPAAAVPVFTLHGWVFKLFPDLFQLTLAMMPQYANGYGSPLQAAGRVEAKLDELCPEGFDGDAFNKWPEEKKVILLTTLHIAALSGLYVYPMRQDGPPDTAEATSPFVCPRCGLPSYHPRDAAERFCAKCGFIDDLQTQ